MQHGDMLTALAWQPCLTSTCDQEEFLSGEKFIHVANISVGKSGKRIG